MQVRQYHIRPYFVGIFGRYIQSVGSCCKKNKCQPPMPHLHIFFLTAHVPGQAIPFLIWDIFAHPITCTLQQSNMATEIPHLYNYNILYLHMFLAINPHLQGMSNGHILSDGNLATICRLFGVSQLAGLLPWVYPSITATKHPQSQPIRRKGFSSSGLHDFFATFRLPILPTWYPKGHRRWVELNEP